MLDRALIILLFQQIDYNRFSNHQLIREIEVSKHVMERTYTIDNSHISHESIALLYLTDQSGASRVTGTNYAAFLSGRSRVTDRLCRFAGWNVRRW